MKESGVLLPIPAIPSKYGIGNIGEASAIHIVQFMKKAGQKWLNILPIFEMGEDNHCPYVSIADYILAVLIDPEGLRSMGLVTQDEISSIYGDCTNGAVINYQQVEHNISQLLEIAFSNFGDFPENSDLQQLFREFVSNEVQTYGIFRVCREVYGYVISEWPDDIRQRDNVALNAVFKNYTDRVKYWEFVAFLANLQYNNFKCIMNMNGISIYGDIPFYYGLDSMAVWLNPTCFEVEPYTLEMLHESGAAPDYFAKDGQHWSTPCYREWLKDGFINPCLLALWKKRIRDAGELYDAIRLDHFRGIDSPWKWDMQTGKGDYSEGAGIKLIDAIKSVAGNVSIIAEDLGDLSYGHTRELLKESGFPGIKVCAFGVEEPTGEHWPSNWSEHVVGYTGTHDNDTLRSMLNSNQEVLKLLGSTDVDKACWNMIESVLRSNAQLSIISFVDLFNTPRYNIPGQIENCWSVRLPQDAFSSEAVKKLAKLTKESGRA